MEQSINTRIFDSTRTLFDDLADDIASHIESLMTIKREISFALSGGGTPRTLYQTIAETYTDLNWSMVNFYFGDERYVPHDHIHSNFRMAKESLFEPLNIRERNIFPMLTHYPNPADAATAYEKILMTRFNSAIPQFDILLLGIGPDGHTASLFPTSSAISVKDKWVAVGQSPNEPRTRLTLTLPVINHARRIIFMAIGADKAEAVQAAIKGHCEHHTSPAEMVRPVNGKLEWWLDHAAASKL